MTVRVEISHSFSGFNLDVAFEAPSGVTALFGPSGAGKSTIVQSVAGLLTPQKGRVFVSGKAVFDSEKRLNLPPQKRHLGYVFQEPRLFPHMSVSRNISFGPRARRQDMDKDFHAQIIDMLGLAPLMDRRPAGLSGGEKQRVALARALVSRPDILLLDEPLAALDAARKEEILPYLERLRDQGGIPMLYVSHSVSEVARLATRVVLLKEGRITQFGAVEEVFSSTDAVATLGLRESGAVLRARVTAHHQDGLTELEGAGTRLFLPKVKARVGDQVRLRIKASDVMLSLSKPEGISALNVIEGVITEMLEGQGPGVLVRLKSKDAHLIARVTRRSARAMGLVSGQKLFAIMKSVSVAHADIGT